MAGHGPSSRTRQVAEPPAWQAGSFPHERLDVYHVASAFSDLVGAMGRLPRRRGYLGDELERASLSIVLNIVEGASRYAPKEQAHFFALARGSAAESAGVVAIAVRRGLITEAQADRARSLLTRIAAMLTGLIASVESRAKKA